MKYIITIEDNKEDSADFVVSLIAKEGERHGTASALMIHIKQSVDEFTEKHGKKTEITPWKAEPCLH